MKVGWLGVALPGRDGAGHELLDLDVRGKGQVRAEVEGEG